MAPPRSARAFAAGLLALSSLALAGPAAASDDEHALYQWEDAEGVVRYTPDPGRVPASRRSTMRRVEPGAWKAPVARRPATGAGLPVAAGATAAGLADPPVVGEPLDETDPWNSPTAARAVESAVIEEPSPSGATGTAPRAGGTALPGRSGGRIAELEAEIARDQEALKEMISAGGSDGADSADEVREIAHRLPALQRELEKLRARSARQ